MTDVVDLKALVQRALELIKAGDFGDEAVRVNQEIVARAPNDDTAWTRLGRCHLERHEFDEAVTSLRHALALNPSKTVATNLLGEVRKRRAMTPNAVERASTGFSTREFALIETLSGDQLVKALSARMAALFDSLNASTVAGRVVDARRRAGEKATKMFHANSYYPGSEVGHVYAFQYGGRWEPQLSLGWFTEPIMPSCLRVGIGFNMSRAGQDVEAAAGQERAVRYFERFQRVVAKAWQRALADWMAANGGFLQYGDQPPARDLVPARAVEWLLNCHHPAAFEWIFVGRWLFLDNSDHARILSDRARLASAIDDSFRALLPLWLATYDGVDTG